MWWVGGAVFGICVWWVRVVGSDWLGFLPGGGPAEWGRKDWEVCVFFLVFSFFVICDL